MSLLDEVSTAAARVAEKSGQAVVRIGRDGGRGAGVVTAPGTVVTSAHNLRGQEVTITFSDGRTVTGAVKGVDLDADIAVVGADTAAISPIDWAPSERPEAAVGSVVFALGRAPGSATRVTLGTVSAVGVSFRGPRGRLITDGFEHTAPVGRGSSGGPVVDAEGRLLGVNTHRPGEGFYLARPADAALEELVGALGRGEVASRRKLGVALTPPHVARRLRAAVGLDPHEGVLIREVAEDGPAAAAGLLRGDLIVAAGGSDVSSIDGLLGAIDAVGEDGRLAVVVLRGNDRVEAEVSFAAPDA